MEFVGPLSWMAMAIATLAPPVLGLIAGAGLVDCVSDAPTAAGARRRGIAALSAAAVAPACAGLITLDAFDAGGLGLQAFFFALAILAMPLVPVLARGALARSEATRGWLHRVAAWPFWSVAVCLSGVLAVGGQSVSGFLFLLAPTVLLGVAAVDAVRGMFKQPVRTNSEVLAFIAPTAGLTSCAVCAEPVRSRRVTCTTCRAVQHRECYEFIGHCGGAGCTCQRVS